MRLLLACVALLALSACSKRESAAVNPDAPVPKHHHHPPHGGTLVVLGDEANHLELVRDPADPGRMEAYLLDGELEQFIRIAQPSLMVTVTVDGQKRPLEFKGVANPATGDALGNTSEFVAEADWLKTAPDFDAVLDRIDVHGTVFEHVAFNFPKGNDTD